jgi:hypothetical protein
MFLQFEIKSFYPIIFSFILYALVGSWLIFVFQKPHENFRLWLSSDPHPKFPISILQRAIKLTTEPPKGLRNNLSRLYNNVTPDQFSKCNVRSSRRIIFVVHHVARFRFSCSNQL